MVVDVCNGVSECIGATLKMGMLSDRVILVPEFCRIIRRAVCRSICLLDSSLFVPFEPDILRRLASGAYILHRHRGDGKNIGGHT